jgi:uridine kinase
MEPAHRILIGIVGGSASGKTWLADQLNQQLPVRGTRLMQDHFYRHRPTLTPALRKRINFDHPRALDWPLWSATLLELYRGETVSVPSYDFSTSLRNLGPGTRLEPDPMWLIDGLWLFRKPLLRQLFTVRIFLECPDATRLARRLARDTKERQRSEDSIVRQFQQHVAPMHDTFVEPQRRWADLVVPSPIDQGAMKTLVRLLTLPNLADPGLQRWSVPKRQTYFRELWSSARG